MTLHQDLRRMMPGVGYRARSVDLSEGDSWRQAPSGLYVPVERRPERPTCVDLFCGAGGFSLGMHQAGMHVVAAADGWPAAARTYLLNLGAPETRVHVLPGGFEGQTKAETVWMREHAGETMTALEFFASAPRGRSENPVDADPPGSGWISSERDHEPGTCAEHIDDEERRVEFCESYHAPPPHREPCLHFFLGDIRRLTGRLVLDALGAEVGEINCVVGGPPCQGFSTAGKRDVMDPRNSLVFDWARLVLEIRPRTMVMENVPNMLNMVTPEGVPVVDALCRVLEDGGWASFNAVKRSLEGMAGRRAAFRSGSRSAHDTDERAQLELLEADG